MFTDSFFNTYCLHILLKIIIYEFIDYVLIISFFLNILFLFTKHKNRLVVKEMDCVRFGWVCYGSTCN